VISVAISSQPFEKTEIEAFSQVIISGETLSNCEEWKALLELSEPAHFEVVCEDTAAAGARALSGRRSLMIKGVKGSDGPSKWILYAAVAAGAVAVIVVFVVVVVCCKKKRHRRHQKDGAEGSYSYSYSRSYSLPSEDK
jgi:hypothetical protein